MITGFGHFRLAAVAIAAAAGWLPLAACGSDGDEGRADPSDVATDVSTDVSVDDCGDVLRPSCEGESVERLQRLLRERVDADLEVNGVFDRPTADALAVFEELICPTSICDVDGEIEVDGAEWRALEEAALLATGPEPSP